jgi:hypothetical protein
MRVPQSAQLTPETPRESTPLAIQAVAEIGYWHACHFAERHLPWPQASLGKRE